MKKLYLVLAATAMFAIGGAAFARGPQDAQNSQPPSQSGQGHGQGRGEGHGQGMMSPDAMLEHMSQELSLTDDQKAKLKPILEDQAKQMQELRKDTSSSDQDRHAKMKQIHENTISQMRPILNADQQKKLEEMMSRRSEHGKREHDGNHSSGSKPQ